LDSWGISPPSGGYAVTTLEAATFLGTFNPGHL
jgi:hypothetical protein